MTTDQEIKSMCWHQQYVIDEMNRFVDMHIKGHNVQEHMRPLTDLLALCEKNTDLLDLGTGTAMIAPLCKDFKFYGADLPHIIIGCAIRNQPDYFYRSCDIIQDELQWIKRFDIIVLNGVIDVMYNGPGILRRVLTYAGRYVIIHRQEITEQGNTQSIVNGSYGGKTYHSIINRNEFNNLVDEMGFEIVAEKKLNFSNWENGGSSFLLKNKNFEDKKYESHPLRQLRNRIQQSETIKLVIGGGDRLHDPDWIVTNFEELDVENRQDWEFLLKDRKVDYIFSEHVWEHLRNPQQAIKNVYDFLKDDGLFRVAVPDGYHTDPNYIEAVKPGGTGAGADDHQVLWNITSLGKALRKVGFMTIAREYWGEDNEFHHFPWNPSLGWVKRSLQYDERNIDGQPIYTSLIIDAIK